MQLDGVSALALMVIVSFAIDRPVTGLLFLLSFTRYIPEAPTGERGPDRRYKLDAKLPHSGSIQTDAPYGRLRLFARPD